MKLRRPLLADPYDLGFLGGGFFGDSIWVLDYGVPRIAFVAP